MFSKSECAQNLQALLTYFLGQKDVDKRGLSHIRSLYLRPSAVG